MKNNFEIGILGFLILMLIFVSCNRDEKYPDFETDKSGLKYKIISKGQSEERISADDYIELELKYKNLSDSVLFDSKELSTAFRMQVKKISHAGGSFENAVFISNPGDKLLFVLPADSFYTKTMGQAMPRGVGKNTDLFFEMKILRKLDPNEIIKDREQLIKQMKEQEDLLIKNYVTENNIEIEPNLSGLYLIKNRPGKGDVSKTGDKLTVNYVGKFVDGRIFDSSYARKEPFSFRLGAGEVIDAWEEGCIKMKVGEKITIIVPSHLAYGKEGYGKLIPPYSTLIFEIELLSIK
jgi:FKBP-type peptidyl-prolyl cis-trans isomerase FkpA